MPSSVFAGEHRKAAEQEQCFELVMLGLGLAEKRIPLNGGSDTRRAARQYWQQVAAVLGIRYRANGTMVILGSSR